MKSLTIFLFFTYYMISANAQNSRWALGIEGGPDECGISGLNEGFALPGFSAGFTGEYTINQKFSVKSGILFQIKGNYSYRTATDSMGLSMPGSYFTTTDRLDYLILPAYIKMYLGKKVKFYLDCGPYFGFLLNYNYSIHYHKNTGPDVVESTNKPGYFNSVDLGASIGLGISIPVKSKLAIDFGLRFDSGLLTLNPLGPNQAAPYPFLNYGFDLTGGLMYKL